MRMANRRSSRPRHGTKKPPVDSCWPFSSCTTDCASYAGFVNTAEALKAAMTGHPAVIRREPEVLSTLMVTAPFNTCKSRSPTNCRRQPWRMGTLRAVRFCFASTSVCRSALVASMVGAIPSSAARAFSTACRSSTMPVDSGSGFRSEGTSGHADGGSASAEVMAARRCPPCRSTSEEWIPRRPRRSTSVARRS